MPVDRQILSQYIDACEQIRETEKEIRKLEQKKKTVIQTNVSGSNPDFPYNTQHFKIEGMAFSYADDSRLRFEEKLLEERKTQAQEIKLEVEQWMLTVPVRMQRIIRMRIFEGMSWGEVAVKMGRRATADSVRLEFQRFMTEK